LNEVCTLDVDHNKKMILTRPLKGDERGLLFNRRVTLDGWLDTGRPKVMIEHIAAMLLRFGSKSTSFDEAKVIAVAWQQTMRLLPDWAVIRTAARFSSGAVLPAEFGAKSIDLSFAPSTAQFHRVASALVQPHYAERNRINDALSGVVPKPRISPEEAGKQVTATLSGFLHRRTVANLDDEQRRARQLAESRARTAAAETSARLREYRDAGLEPPAPKGGVITSLPMMLKAGYTIIDIPRSSKRALLAPAHARGALRGDLDNGADAIGDM